MDHLLRPEGTDAIAIPYVGFEEYDGGNFKGYFTRKGWERKSSGDLIFGNRTTTEKLAFLQTWLYFGCLISIFECVGIQARTRDFIYKAVDGELMVTTQRLQSLITEWIRREGMADLILPDPNPYNPRSMRGYNIIEYLNWTSWHLNMFMKDAEESHSSTSTLPLLELSIMAMGESLSSAWRVIYSLKSSSVPTWGPSHLLKDRLRHLGWCPSNSPFFPGSMATSSISADYYFGSCSPPGELKNHSQCSELTCGVKQTNVDTTNYHAVHQADCKGCDFIISPSETVNIVANREIPMMKWKDGSLTVSKATESSHYVAISHVWSDGLGNDVDEIANSLPRCQLSRIQDLVNRLYTEQHKLSALDAPSSKQTAVVEVGFWMDTLCVPIGEQYYAHRKSAISMMGDIYRKAERVLVLDSLIQEIPCSSGIIDKFLRIHLSNWHHRLWTLQEAQLARVLFFQFQDGAETFGDMAWHERNLNDRDASQICSPIRHNCATQLEDFYNLFRISTKIEDISKRMIVCAKYVRSRTTTRLSDEPLCVATILDLNPKSILSNSTKDGMECFYDLVRKFDPRIIFNEHPRLQSPGYRWAPESFLAQPYDLITMRDVETGQKAPVTLLSQNAGLPVEFPGFMLGEAVMGEGNSTFIIPKKNNVPWRQQLSMSPDPWWKQWFLLELVPDREGKFPIWDSNMKYVVIMYTDLHRDFLPTPAILGTVATEWQPPVGSDVASVPAILDPQLDQSIRSDRPKIWLPVRCLANRIPVNYICRATVSMPPQEELTDLKANFGSIASQVPGLQSLMSLIGISALHTRQKSQTIHPISATIYSRQQKWSVM